MSSPDSTQAPPRTDSRKVKLILPQFQLRLIGVFASLSILALALQYLVFSAAIAQTSSRLPNDGVALMDQMQPLLLKVLGVSMLLLAPILFWAGILATFRIAGPLYRFHEYLGAVARGERPADCKLRAKDQLHSLCELINAATRPLREGAPAEDSATGADAQPQRDAA
jgi:hypothetical protein